MEMFDYAEIMWSAETGRGITACIRRVPFGQTIHTGREQRVGVGGNFPGRNRCSLLGGWL
jgi:hypothetical protein